LGVDAARSSNGYALIWFFSLAFLLHIIGLGLLFLTPWAQFLLPWTPNIAAVIVLRFILKEENGVRNLVRKWAIWRVDARWYLVVLLPFVLDWVVVGVFLLLGNSPPGTDIVFSIPLLLFAFGVPMVTGATGEELGWRGFALPRLQSRYSALVSSVILGLIWGVWHLPLWIVGPFLGVGYDLTRFWVFTLSTIALSILITWVVNNTKESVLFATLIHYVSNFSFLLVTTGLGLVTAEFHLITSSILLLIVAFVVVNIFGQEKLVRNQG
jgi:membrane protease YdiL (CAAX protease family)